MCSAPLLPLQQHPNFAEALRLLGQKTTFVDLVDGACVLSLTRFGMKFASRGPIWDAQTSQSARSSALRHSGLRLVNADAPEPDVFKAAGFRLTTTPASVAELDLCGPATERLTRANGKWRNIWRRAQTGPLIIQPGAFDARHHQWVLDADLAQQRSKGYRALPHVLILAYAQCRPKDVILYTALHQSKPVAAMLFLLHHPVATYHVGWCNDHGRHHGAHHRMLMEAADTFSQLNFQRMDLGSVDTENAAGLARFKIGTGAVVRPLGGTWLRVPGL
jgi:hypothetical protein